VVKKRVKKRRKKVAGAAKEGTPKRCVAAAVPPPDFKIEIDETGYLGPAEDLMDIPDLVDRANGKESTTKAGKVPRSAGRAPSPPVKSTAGRAPKTTTNPLDRLQELVTLAKCGDDQAVEQIRRVLDDNPAIWQSVGDLAAHAEMLLINIIADGNEMVVESLKREIDRLKSELMDGEPSPLERLTIQRIVAAWLRAQHVDRLTLAADTAGGKSVAFSKRQESAEKRFQQAIKSLDLVRRLKPRREQRDAKGKAAKPAGHESDAKSLAEQGSGDNCQATPGSTLGEQAEQHPPARRMGHSVNRIRALANSENAPVA
jgi:hypothetical protein